MRLALVAGCKYAADTRPATVKSPLTIPVVVIVVLNEPTPVFEIDAIVLLSVTSLTSSASAPLPPVVFARIAALVLNTPVLLIVVGASLISLPLVPSNIATRVSVVLLIELKTSPPPGVVAQTPSPRQNVDDEADVPLLRFATGKFPEMVEAPRLIVKPAPVAPPVSVLTLVSEDAVTAELSVVPVSVPAGAMTALVEIAVTRPLAFAVIVGIAVDEPKLPTLELTVANVVTMDDVPEPETSPDRVIVALTTAWNVG